jgi:hypothetical protein
VRVRDPKGKSFFAGIGKAGRLAFWDLGGREMADRQSKAIEDFLDSLFLSIAMMIGAIKSGNSGSNG